MSFVALASWTPRGRACHDVPFVYPSAFQMLPLPKVFTRSLLIRPKILHDALLFMTLKRRPGQCRFGLCQRRAPRRQYRT